MRLCIIPMECYRNPARIFEAMEWLIELQSHDEPGMQDVYALRQEILRIPLGLDLFTEDLESEKDQWVLCARNTGNLMGCVMLKPLSDHTLKLRQMAVKEEYQGIGVGKSLVLHAEHLAIDKGYQRIELHARDNAKGFYEKLGYLTDGDTFEEVGIPHFRMIKNF